MERVTIIVGIYNSSEFLNRGLESIRNQTWENLEVLLMDDGSTDSSSEICDSFSNMDKRFISIHKKNSGVCDSRNRGLELATGEYVCFMDGDDWLETDFIEYMMKLIHDTSTLMAFSDKLFTTHDRIQSENDNIETWSSEKAISRIIYPYMSLGPWNKIYSMKLINEYNIRFPSHWFGETLHFASTVAFYAGRVGVGHRKVYDYRLDNVNSGTTQFNVDTRLLSLDNCLNLQKCIFSNNTKISRAIKWHLHACYFTLLVNIIGTDSVDKYRDKYNESLKYIKKNGFNVFIYSDVTAKEKIRILVRTLFPVTYAKRIARKANNRLRKLSSPTNTSKL